LETERERTQFRIMREQVGGEEAGETEEMHISEVEEPAIAK
jgi:hypothetical protein